GPLRSVLDLADAVAQGLGGGSGAGLEVVVDEVDARAAVAAVDRAVLPVEEDVVTEVEGAPHADAGVAARVAGEQIMVERARVAAPGAAERVVVGVQRLAGDRPLDS